VDLAVQGAHLPVELGAALPHGDIELVAQPLDLAIGEERGENGDDSGDRDGDAANGRPEGGASAPVQK
jgi:hypothetical protein